MHYVAVAVPAGLTLAGLSLHISHPAILDELGGELGVTADAIFHNNLAAHVLREDGIVLGICHEKSHVLHAVHPLEEILAHNIVVRDMAVIAGGIAAVGAMEPSGVVRSHNVAVDTCGGIVSQISVRPHYVQKESAKTDEHAGHDNRSDFRTFRGENSLK